MSVGVGTLTGQGLADKVESDLAIERLRKEFGRSDWNFEAWRGTDVDSKRGLNVIWEPPRQSGDNPMRTPPWGATAYVELSFSGTRRAWVVHATNGSLDYGVENMALFPTAYEAGKYIVETMLSVAARKQLGEVFP